MDFSCSLDMSRFEEARARTMTEFQEGFAHAAETAAREGAAEAKSVGKFKDRTGELRRNIRAEKLIEAARGARWKIVSPMPYSLFVEKGTKAHQIWPKAGYRFNGPLRSGQTRRATGKGPHEHIVGRGLALRWKSSDGTVHFAKMVNHPGSHAYAFMGPAALKAERVLYRELELMRARMGTIWKAA